MILRSVQNRWTGGERSLGLLLPWQVELLALSSMVLSRIFSPLSICSFVMIRLGIIRSSSKQPP